jgi:hypothetical protein
MKRRRSLRQRGGLSEKEQEAARQAEQLALLNADPDPVVAAAINAAAKADPNNNNKPAITDMVTQIVNQALKEAIATGKSPVAAAEAAKPAAVNAAINAGTPKGVATAAADAAVAAVANAAVNAGATNQNAAVIANVVADIVNKAVQAANEKGNSPANAAKAAEPAAVNAAINAGASNAVASAAVSAARKPLVLTNYAKSRITRERGAKLYAEIQAGTKTATPAQQACITKYEACKKPTQAGGRHYTRKSRKYYGGDKNQNMKLLEIKNSLSRVNKTAIRAKNHGNMSKLSNIYNTTHHPWNNGFK